MNEELAKKLKEAGYPFRYASHPYEVVRYQFDDGTFAYEPTLSELIEACGEKVAVFHDGTMWTAGKFGTITTNGLMFFDAIFSTACIAETPEEAAANLWLALNV